MGNVEGRTTNLTGRVAHHLQKVNKKEANGQELVDILRDTFIDARLFGSSLAFKEEKKGRTWKPALCANVGETSYPV